MFMIVFNNAFKFFAEIFCRCSNLCKNTFYKFLDDSKKFYLEALLNFHLTFDILKFFGKVKKCLDEIFSNSFENV